MTYPPTQYLIPFVFAAAVPIAHAQTLPQAPTRGPEPPPPAQHEPPAQQLQAQQQQPVLEEDPRSAQVDAATEDAVQKLRADISDERIRPDLTVGDFLQRTGGLFQLIDILHRADQMGGPRWLDSQTCQVKLAMPGSRVAAVLTQIARDSGSKSPIPADALAAKLRDWNSRTFIATGSSISAGGVEGLRPSDSNSAWRQVEEDARRRAVAAAKENAVEHTIDSLRPIPLPNGQILGDALADKAVADRLAKWLQTRPVTEVQFRQDLFAELTLGVYPNELGDALREAMRGTPEEKALSDEAVMSQLRREFAQRVVPPVGRAHVAVPKTSVTTTTTMMTGNAIPVRSAASGISIPLRPPQWVRMGQPLTGDGTAPAGGSRLRTARSAESMAMDKLRERINALPMQDSGTGPTVGEAASGNPAVGRAIDSALRTHAHVYKIDYLADGGATVKVSLDPRDLWDAMRELP